MSVSVFVLFGMLGLAFDLGHMFIIKNELQMFVDASAMAAIQQMDGTQGGIQNANSAASSGPLGASAPNQYDFGSKAISNVTATYATSFNGTYDNYATASTNATNNYRFIQVTANADMPLYFLPAVPGIPTSLSVSASATAGQSAQNSVTNGNLEPFMPDAHNAANTSNFGFVAGTKYTLKWGNGGTTCAGDIGWNDPNPSSQHGFMDLGQGNGNSALTQAIVWGGYPNADSTPSSLSTGTVLSGVPGNRGTQIFNALNTRAQQDTDTTSTTYSQYQSSGTGNGRRVVIMPIGDPSTWSGNGNGTEKVIGFAAFFLDPSYSGNSGAVCATYIGPASLNGLSSGGSDSSVVYSNVLFR
jgi:Flp pilus assembly protein TadG